MIVSTHIIGMGLPTKSDAVRSAGSIDGADGVESNEAVILFSV